MKERLPLIALGLGLFIFAVGQTLFFRATLESDERRCAKIIMPTVVTVLEHAHRLRDDLTAQTIIEGLSQGPGVIFACILDAQGKVLAHTQPSDLGQMYSPRFRQHLVRSCWVHALGKGSDSWGALILKLSGRSSQRRLAIQILFWLLAIGAIGGWATWLLILWYKELGARDRRYLELESIHKEQTLELTSLTQSRQQQEALWVSWLQRSLEQNPQPLLLLDNRQRVVAVNQGALTRLGTASLGSVLGRSWQEVPALEVEAAALQRSLEAPGQPILASLVFFTQEVPNNGGIGTWVSFPP